MPYQEYPPPSLYTPQSPSAHGGGCWPVGRLVEVPCGGGGTPPGIVNSLRGICFKKSTGSPHYLAFSSGGYWRCAFMDPQVKNMLSVSRSGIVTCLLQPAVSDFRLGGMASFGARDQEFYDITLLEPTPPTTFTTHLNPTCNLPP